MKGVYRADAQTKSFASSDLVADDYVRQIARNNLNKFSNADYAKRSQLVFANLNI